MEDGNGLLYRTAGNDFVRHFFFPVFFLFFFSFFFFSHRNWPLPEVIGNHFHEVPVKRLGDKNMDIALDFTGDKRDGCVHWNAVINLCSGPHSGWNSVHQRLTKLLLFFVFFFRCCFFFSFFFVGRCRFRGWVEQWVESQVWHGQSAEWNHTANVQVSLGLLRWPPLFGTSHSFLGNLQPLFLDSRSFSFF